MVRSQGRQGGGVGLAVVLPLTALLTQHHQAETLLLALIRAGSLTPDTWDTTPSAHRHDHLEREILFAMAEATDDEIQQAITAYEAAGGWL